MHRQYQLNCVRWPSFPDDRLRFLRMTNTAIFGVKYLTKMAQPGIELREMYIIA